MSDGKICKVTHIRREVCNVLRPDDCFQDKQEEPICGTSTEVQKELSKICAPYYTGIGPGSLWHKQAWSCGWKKD